MKFFLTVSLFVLSVSTFANQISHESDDTLIHKTHISNSIVYQIVSCEIGGLHHYYRINNGYKFLDKVDRQHYCDQVDVEYKIKLTGVKVFHEMHCEDGKIKDYILLQNGNESKKFYLDYDRNFYCNRSNRPGPLGKFEVR